MNIPVDAPYNVQKAFKDVWDEVREITARLGELEKKGASSSEIDEVRRDLAKIAQSKTFLTSIEMSNIHGQPYCIMSKSSDVVHNSSGNWLQFLPDLPWDFPWREDITPSGWFAAELLGLADAVAIGNWANRIRGQGTAFTQATGALQPLNKTNILNGLAVVRFDGVDDFMALGAALTALLQDLSNGTVFIVARQEAAVANERTIWTSNITASGTGMAVDAAADNLKCFNYDGNQDVATKSSAAQGIFHTFVWHHENGNIYAGVDNSDLSALSGVASGAGTDYSGGGSDVFLGKNQAGTIFWKDDIAEMVFVSAAWREETRRRMMNQISKKYALAIGSAAPVINPMADLTNNRITILLPGEYIISGMQGWAANATGFRGVVIVKNGIYPATSNDCWQFDLRNAINGGGTHGTVGRVSVRCRAGDYFTMSLFQNSGGTLNAIHDLNQFSAHWVRP